MFCPVKSCCEMGVSVPVPGRQSQEFLDHFLFPWMCCPFRSISIGQGTCLFALTTLSLALQIKLLEVPYWPRTFPDLAFRQVPSHLLKIIIGQSQQSST